MTEEKLKWGVYVGFSREILRQFDTMKEANAYATLACRSDENKILIVKEVEL